MNSIRSCVFVAASIDGFIAGPNGELDWLEDKALAIDGEDFGYARFLSGCDYLVMGRHTFEKVATFESWPYDGVRVVVASSTLERLPHGFAGVAELTNLLPYELVAMLEKRGARKLYIDGGITIQNFLKEGLVDEMTITVVPRLLGGGKPLFASLGKTSSWRLKSSRSYCNGMVQNHYILER